MALIAQGRQDWQRTDPRDSIPILVEHGVGHQGTSQTAVFNVAGFSSLSGNILLQSGGPVQFQVTFFHDAGATQLAGYRVWVQDSAGAANAQLSLRCLGPYVRFTVTPLTGATVWQWTVDIAACNRPSELMFTPAQATLASWASVNIGAGATSTLTFTELAAGPVTFSAGASAAGLEPWLEAELASGVWVRILQGDMVGTNHFHRAGVLPPLPCRANVNNPTGAGIVFAGSVVASLTGST